MQEWRLRFQEKGPAWVSWLLAALIAAEFAHAVVADPSARHGQTPAPIRARASPTPTGINVNAIVAAHLFGIESAKSVRDPAAAVPTTADLHLRGTLATGNPRHGWAIIADDSAETVYHVGQAGRAFSLYSVYADHVLLDREGSLESLALPHRLEPFRAPSAVAVTEAAEAPAGDKPHRLADIMLAEPEHNDDSQNLTGFRIAPVGPASTLIRAGLRPHDVVTAINGTPLADQDPQHSREVLDAAMASGSASFTVRRGGKQLDVSVNAAQ
jgi:general secretion pathway protein C